MWLANKLGCYVESNFLCGGGYTNHWVKSCESLTVHNWQQRCLCSVPTCEFCYLCYRNGGEWAAMGANFRGGKQGEITDVLGVLVWEDKL